MSDGVLELQTGHAHSGLTASLRVQTDAELVRATLDGDLDAFGELYRRHRGAVAAVCRNQLYGSPGSEAVAEEIAHEVFLRLLGAIGSISEPGKVDRWLKRAAKNLCIDHRRSAASRYEVEVEEGLAERLAEACGDSMEESILARAVVVSILAGVPDTDAWLLREHYLQDRPLREIAELHDSTPGSVKVRLHRARRRAERFGIAEGLRSICPLAFLRWGHRASSAANRPESLAVTTVMAPVLIGMAMAVTVIGGSDQRPAASANEGQSRVEALMPTRSSGATGAAFSRESITRDHDVRKGGTKRGVKAEPRKDRPADSPPQPHIPFEPVQVPLTDRKVRPGPEEGEPHSHYIEADTGAEVGGNPVSVGVSDHHGTKEARPVFKNGCKAAEEAPSLLTCERGPEVRE